MSDHSSKIAWGDTGRLSNRRHPDVIHLVAPNNRAMNNQELSHLTRGDRPMQVSYLFKVALVLLDCIFLGIQPVLVHMSKNSSGNYSYKPLVINLMVEISKTLFAYGTLLFLRRGHSKSPFYWSFRSFIEDAKHNKLLFVPALLYAVNNYLKFQMQLYFPPTTFKMLGNLKIFTIALLMRLVLKRRFNIMQYEALFLLVAGITVNQLNSCPSAAARAAAAAVPVVPAFCCTLATITVPAAASVYNEFALKKHMDTSVHQQNFFLYFFGLCLNLGFLGVNCLWNGTTDLAGLMTGLSPVTYLLVVANAGQGVLASFFYKYADTILKKYSSTIATIFTALTSYFAFQHELTINFVVGVSIVLISMHQFFTLGDKPGVRPKADWDAPRPAGLVGAALGDKLRQDSAAAAYEYDYGYGAGGPASGGGSVAQGYLTKSGASAVALAVEEDEDGAVPGTAALSTRRPLLPY